MIKTDSQGRIDRIAAQTFDIFDNLENCTGHS